MSVAYYCREDAADLSLDEKAQWFSPAFLQERALSTRFCGGRGQTALMTFPAAMTRDLGLLEDVDGKVGLCHRQYLRGGLIGKVCKKSFFIADKRAHRARDEFVMLQQMLDLGLPVPQPVLAKEICIAGLWLQSEILIQTIDNTQNLAEVLYTRPFSQAELKEIGVTLARFFQKKVVHTDLNLRNVLLDTKGHCFVIDFDKCHFAQKELSTAVVNKMVDRLERSFVKECSKAAHAKKSFHYEDVYMQDLRIYIRQALG